MAHSNDKDSVYYNKLSDSRGGDSLKMRLRSGNIKELIPEAYNDIPDDIRISIKKFLKSKQSNMRKNPGRNLAVIKNSNGRKRRKASAIRRKLKMAANKSWMNLKREKGLCISGMDLVIPFPSWRSKKKRTYIQRSLLAIVPSKDASSTLQYGRISTWLPRVCNAKEASSSASSVLTCNSSESPSHCALEISEEQHLGRLQGCTPYFRKRKSNDISIQQETCGKRIKYMPQVQYDFKGPLSVCISPHCSPLRALKYYGSPQKDEIIVDIGHREQITDIDRTADGPVDLNSSNTIDDFAALAPPTPEKSKDIEIGHGSGNMPSSPTEEKEDEQSEQHDNSLKLPPQGTSLHGTLEISSNNSPMATTATASVREENLLDNLGLQQVKMKDRSFSAGSVDVPDLKAKPQKPKKKKIRCKIDNNREIGPFEWLSKVLTQKPAKETSKTKKEGGRKGSRKSKNGVIKEDSQEKVVKVAKRSMHSTSKQQSDTQACIDTTDDFFCEEAAAVSFENSRAFAISQATYVIEKKEPMEKFIRKMKHAVKVRRKSLMGIKGMARIHSRLLHSDLFLMQPFYPSIFKNVNKKKRTRIHGKKRQVKIHNYDRRIILHGTECPKNNFPLLDHSHMYSRDITSVEYKHQDSHDLMLRDSYNEGTTATGDLVIHEGYEDNYSKLELQVVPLNEKRAMISHALADRDKKRLLKKFFNRIFPLTEEDLRMYNKVTFGTEYEANMGRWNPVRENYEAMADEFISGLTPIQGSRLFTGWYGTVTDSVVGAFLTQNVSDVLSSSAFMYLASCFPPVADEQTTEEVILEEKQIEETFSLVDSSESFYYNAVHDDSFSGNNLLEHAETVIKDAGIDDKYSSLTIEQVSEVPISDLVEMLSKCTIGLPCVIDEQHYGCSMNSVHSHHSRKINSSCMEEQLSRITVDTGANKYEEPVKEIDQMCWVSSLGCSFSHSQASLDNNIRKMGPNVGNEGLCRQSNKLQKCLCTKSDLQSMHDECKSQATPSDAAVSLSITHTSLFSNSIQENMLVETGKCSHLSANTHNFNYASSGMPLNLSSADIYCEEECSNWITSSYKKGKRSPRTKESTSKINDKSNLSKLLKLEQRWKVLKQLHEKTGPKPTWKFLKGLDRAVFQMYCEPKTKVRELDWDTLKMDIRDRFASSKRIRDPESKQSLKTNIRERFSSSKRPRDPKRKDAVNWDAVREADLEEIVKAIKERGMESSLAGRIKRFLLKLHQELGSIDLEWLRDVTPLEAKSFLLSIHGLGLKSVECIRLLTLHQQAFPVDTNVSRIAVRLGWVPIEDLPRDIHLHVLDEYPLTDRVQQYLWPRICEIDREKLYQLHYHMITFGKVICTKRMPNCNACPFTDKCRYYNSSYRRSIHMALPDPRNQPQQETSRLQLVSEHSPHVSLSMTSLNNNQYPFDPSILTRSFGAGSCTTEIHLPGEITWPYHQSYLHRSKNIPIIEEPEDDYSESDFDNLDYSESDIEDFVSNDSMTTNVNISSTNEQECDLATRYLDYQPPTSTAVVLVPPEISNIPVRKLKEISRLRTEHCVYEIPDNHPLIAQQKLEKRVVNDPNKYLLLMASFGDSSTCGNMGSPNNNTVKGTLLIPSRTAMRGSFPLNGTYFQVNEVFADHETSLRPLEISRNWIWYLKQKTVYFGTSVSSICRGLSQEQIRNVFWNGVICVRAFDRKVRAPRPLAPRLHSKLSQGTKRKEEN